MLPPLTLVLGGAASGKSAWAENLLLSSDLELFYVATARLLDAEIKSKKNVHKMRRGPRWTDIEAPDGLEDALSCAQPGSAYLLDCTTMWLTNRLMDGKPLSDSVDAFMQDIANSSAPLVIVSNEIGQGIVPEHALSREFREVHGRLNIAIAAKADLVVQVIAGLPNVIKGTLP